jgi:hypothetical protein
MSARSLPSSKSALACGLAVLLLTGCDSKPVYPIVSEDPTGGAGGDNAAGSPGTGGQTSGGEGTVGGEGNLGGAGTGGGNLGGSSANSGEPYANVVRVEPTGTSGAYTFAVSVESSDIDCSQYVDYWEVLDESGALIFRHGLNHSHTDENGTTDAGAPGNTFTRSGGPVPVSETDTVLIRAHLFPVGYSGDVLRGSVAAGFALATDLPDSFAAALENEPPAPPACQF